MTPVMRQLILIVMEQEKIEEKRSRQTNILCSDIIFAQL